MLFRFMDASSGGTEIMLDQHAAATSNAVTVSNGLFNTQLGGGTITDGAGPGVYTTLAEMFRDYGSVWLEVRVGAETLAPRTSIQSAAYALNASNLGGKGAGSFIDTSSAAQTKVGTATFDASAQAGSYGVQAFGNYAAGHFKGGASGEVFAGFADTGIEIYGSYAAGTYRHGTPASYDSEILLGDSDLGVKVTGAGAGGWFETRDNSSSAFIAFGGEGIIARGNSYGLEATSSNKAGYFYNTSPSATGYSALAEPHTRLRAYGTYTGNCDFCSSPVVGKDARYSGEFALGDGDTGILARGKYAGALFRHLDSSGVVDIHSELAFAGGYGISSNGTKNFVQNHPVWNDKSIHYASLEGDEVGVYSRGSGRLERGRARIELSGSFQWVTNPEIGLTAQLTPRGRAVPLAVESISTTELVVVGPPDFAVDFDYVVFGLRIGFEAVSIVTERTADDPIPSQEFHEQ